MIIKRLFITFVFSFVCTLSYSASNKWVPSIVEIKSNETTAQFYVNGAPYPIRGVGMDYNEGERLAALQAAGGNTFRTWSVQNLDAELELAVKHDLMIAVGINVQKELEGFDYNDEVAVKEQFEWVKGVVQKYKNHPNILCWVIANEANLLINEEGGLDLVNPNVYAALSDIIDYIHQVDPNHPVTYTFAGVIDEHIKIAMQYTPQIDFISYQVYGGLAAVPDQHKALNLSMPFMVTEFGPQGHWEQPSTEWGREIEEPSAPKARGMGERMYHAFVKNRSPDYLGAFAFLWGQKQERTPTWYGMLDKEGRQDARVDELIKFWTGKYPENRAPLTESIYINKKQATDNVYLQPREKAKARVRVTDPDGDQLTTVWRIMKEVDVRSHGGLFEKEPKTLNFKPIKQKENRKGSEITFVVPEDEGDYRLFAYSYDKGNKVGTANIPFYVKKEKPKKGYSGRY